MMLAQRSILLLALLLLLASALLLTSDAVNFSKKECREHKLAWKAIQALHPCWSGAMSVYTIHNNNNHMQLQQRPTRNFRLQIQTSRKGVGTWTVWNLNQVHEEIVVPLAETPPFRPTQLKFGFQKDGMIIILRIPNAITSQIPRLAFEIGFWDRSMRRTAVAEYKRRSFLSRFLPGWWNLKEMTLVQMKAESPHNFVGNMTDTKAISVLPLEEPCIEDLQLQQLEAICSETIYLPTMERTTSKWCTQRERNQVYSNVIEKLLQHDRSDIFTKTLPNGLCVSMPKHLPSKNGRADPNEADHDPISCVFCFQKKNVFHAVEVTYRPDTMEAERVSLHTFVASKKQRN